MKHHLSYLWYVLRHKWYVYHAGRRLGLGHWQLFIHDWTKFLPIEWNPYVAYFNTYRGKEKPLELQLAFEYGWNHHQKYNKHHWQYWLLTFDKREKPPWSLIGIDVNDGPIPVLLMFNATPIATLRLLYGEENANVDANVEDLAEQAVFHLNATWPMPMPDKYIREMVADWQGAGRALGMPNTKAWYHENQDHMILHPRTRLRVEELLESL